MERTIIKTLFVIFILVQITKGYDEYEGLSTNYQSDDNPEMLARIKTSPTENYNHKPLFTQCSTYNPTIKEEQPRGLPVIQIHADDNDPPESGGTITYKIVRREGDRSYFAINETTGAITTNLASEFDRDEPTRMKEIYITVQATDNGRPVLADICTFKVTVQDINDNSPSFDKYEYEEKVSEDAKINREVMRVVAYDIDDGNNARLTYRIRPDGTDGGREFDKYFEIDRKTGVLNLKESLQNKRGVVFNSIVVVEDNPDNISERRESTASIKITVVGSDKKPPSFTRYPSEKKVIKENYQDYTNPIVTLEATSNIDEPEVIFELLKGLTTQTNKDSTFVLEQNGTQALIKLGRALDYETVSEYVLTIRCTNKDSWSVIRTIDIEIEDVNDEIPTFIELVTGSVLENEEPNAEVMQVRAVDKDGTSANNIVTYELADHKDLFAIDPNNGKVTTKVSFDREKQRVYNVIIVAKDNSRSSLHQKPYNSASQTFRITIEDRNDNSPVFTNKHYTAERIPENSDIGKDVIEVKANDPDTASLIQYKIIAGNIGDAFAIESTTGRIKVNAPLDFEKIEYYNLTVEANDGIYNDTATVHIEILNVNDELPIFEPYDKNINIREEEKPLTCIITLRAYDPDIKDRNADQKIVYRVRDEHKEFLSVDNDGCVMLIKALDRDKPYGYPNYQAYILAYDDGDSPNSKTQATELYITLEDINDNAPFLNVTEVVWYENRPPGEITVLQADDYDSPENGPPFRFSIAPEAGEQIKSNFFIENDRLHTKVTFDREEKKYYDIPIEIEDSGVEPLKGVSILHLIIGDENDNKAKSGSSSIFVYNYKGMYGNIEIGRVYVDDPDDWDLDDKVFTWQSQNKYFDLNPDNGSIIMLPGVPAGDHTLNFYVTEEHPPEIESHRVDAEVKVTVKDLPEEAVTKSGSIRLEGCSVEAFIEKANEIDRLSRKDYLQKYLANILNTSIENVDIITVLKSPKNNSQIDVRFSAHGSPYYAPEKLNSKISQSKYDLERELDVKFVMINIDECLQEKVCEKSCTNKLNINEREPAVVFTNHTSFVGVQAIVEADCFGECPARHIDGCYNGGISVEDTACTCADAYEGPHCEMLGIGFTGDGWAMYKDFEACEVNEIRLEVAAVQENGLIFYVGPISDYPLPLANDFMSLELKHGYPYLLLNYGSGTIEVYLRHKKLTDGASHSIRIQLQKKEVLLSIDDCHQSSCQILKEPKSPNYLLNVNGPLQVGGIRDDINTIASKLNWEYTPTSKGFDGCIKNLTYNGFVYNLGVPGEHKNANPNCNYGVAKAVSFGIDTNFLVTILVCISTLLILLLAVVVHRRKHDNWGEKDTDDIRETIISYEDEGGGEGDTGFDLSVLRRVHEDEYPIKDKAPEMPDISRFLKHKKDIYDRDSNSYPFDDVRYYAYEGDGNSTGSLSSLASCTDDGDLKFNYLSSFGPRFRKLADMYGEDPSDDDSHDGGEESWC